MKEIFFCLNCKKELKLINNCDLSILRCDFCDISFLYKNGIAVFETNLPKVIEDFWENYFEINKERSVELYLKEFFNKKDFFPKMLDLGCGDGRSAEAINTIADTLFCLDSSFSCLSKLKQRNLKNIVAIQGDGKNIPFPDNFFDGIISLSVVEHIPRENLSDFFKEVHRVLKKDGIFLVRNDAWFYGILEKLRILPNQCGKVPDVTHVSMMTGGTLCKELKKANFEIIKEDHFPFYRFEKKYNIKIPRFVARFFSTHSNFICKPIKTNFNIN